MKNYTVSFNHYELGIIEVIIQAENIQQARQILSDKGIKYYTFVDSIYKKEEVLLKASISNLKEYEDLIAQLKETLDNVNKFELKLLIEEPKKEI